MTIKQSETKHRKSKDYLWLHLRELPYFRALLRSVESRFYDYIELPAPVLDLGCGDGLFANLTFESPLDIGIDPWWKELIQAQQIESHKFLVQSEGAALPFPDEVYSSVVSNSVLEHIPDIDEVLLETARVLKPGAVFVFCVPNHNFLTTLSIGKWFDQLGLQFLGDAYRGFFNRISRHLHCDPPEVWESRLAKAGYKLERWWHYFSPAALRAMEWGHYFGLPSWICKIITGRWIICPTSWNLAITRHFIQRFYDEQAERNDGVYTFYISRRV